MTYRLTTESLPENTPGKAYHAGAALDVTARRGEEMRDGWMPSDDELYEMALDEWMLTGRIDAKDRLLAVTDAGEVPDPQVLVARDLQELNARRSRPAVVPRPVSPARRRRAVMPLAALVPGAVLLGMTAGGDAGAFKPAVLLLFFWLWLVLAGAKRRR
jgi:hypothetical protein